MLVHNLRIGLIIVSPWRFLLVQSQGRCAERKWEGNHGRKQHIPSRKVMQEHARSFGRSHCPSSFLPVCTFSYLVFTDFFFFFTWANACCFVHFFLLEGQYCDVQVEMKARPSPENCDPRVFQMRLVTCCLLIPKEWMLLKDTLGSVSARKDKLVDTYPDKGLTNQTNSLRR